MNDQKRYQVFVSSTFEDLKEERQKIIQSLLELNCFPCSMEFFPAADEEVWEAIKALISECDYYLVIVGGKYGSVDPEEGISYTEKEYRFAVEKGIPVIAFLHGDPSTIPMCKSEERPKFREKLNQFRELCQKKMCRNWMSPDDLKAKVTTSLVALMKKDHAVGWVRANTIAPESAKEILRLRDEINSLKGELAKFHGPAAVDNLAQGDEPVNLTFKAKGESEQQSHQFTWNQIFETLGFGLLHGLNREGFASLLTAQLIHKTRPHLNHRDITISYESLMKILVQLRSLDLIKQGSELGTWIFTSYGEERFLKLKALKKGQY